MALDTENALATLAEAKVHLGIAVADTDYDTMVENLLNGAAYFVNTFCNRQVKSRTHIEYYDGDGTPVLYVCHPPITGVAALYVSTDSPRVYGAAQELDSDYLLTDADAGLVRYLDGVFSKGMQTVKIEYTGGWDITTPTLPWDLRNAYLNLVKWEFERWKANRINYTQQTIQSITVNLQAETPPDVLDVLKRYRIAPRRGRYYGG